MTDNTEFREPIIFKRKKVGYIDVAEKKTLKAYKQEELNFVKRVANHMGPYLHNSQLFSELTEKNERLETLTDQVTDQNKELSSKNEQLISLQDKIVQEKVKTTQIEERERQTKDLTNGIIHEIKGSFITFKGIIKTLQHNDSGSPEAKKELLNSIGEEANRLYLLAANYLQNQLYEGGISKLRGSKVYLKERAQHALSANEYYLSISGLDVDIQLSEDSFGEGWDQEQLQLLMNNIVNNAAKYAGKSPVLRIQEHHDESHITLVFYSYDAAKEKAYNPSDLENSNGHGVRICRFIVEAHQGEIRYEKNQDQGLSITVRLPKTLS